MTLKAKAGGWGVLFILFQNMQIGMRIYKSDLNQSKLSLKIVSDLHSSESTITVSETTK